MRASRLSRLFLKPGSSISSAAAHTKSMTENISRQPKGIPTGGQFAATARSEPEVSLSTPVLENSEEVQHREFWERAATDAAERQERIRKHEEGRLARVAGQGGVQDEAPATYEHVPEAVPPLHTGLFRRAFAALGGFSTSAEERHQSDMDEIVALTRGSSMVPKFLRRNK